MFCEVVVEEMVKPEEQVAEADVVVAGLFAATVLRHAHPFELNFCKITKHVKMYG